MRKSLQMHETQAAGFGVLTRCILSLIFLILAPAIVEALIPMDLPAEKLSPVPGESIEKNLASDEIHSYAIELSKQSFLRIDFYSPDTDLRISLTEPDGRESQNWDISRRAITPISSIADSQGIYELKVQNLDRNGVDGSYLMKIRNVRQATDQDSKQVAACRHLSNAAQFRHQWTESSLRESIREYEEALRIWTAIEDWVQQAAALKKIGEIWKMLGEWQTAMACYERAQAIHIRRNDPLGEAEIINAISALCINQGEYQKAIEIYTAEHRAIENPRLKANRLRNFGAAYRGMGDMERATDFLNQALEIWTQLQDMTGQADVLLHLGYVSNASKDISRAEQYYGSSLALSTKAGNPLERANALAGLGHIANISGERQEALEHYNHALKIFEQIGDLAGRYIVLEGMAYLYASLGENKKALNYYKEALTLARQTKDLAAEAEILAYISITHRELGDYQNALHYSQAALDVYRSIKSTLGESYSLANQGMILEALERRKEADVCFTQALNLSQKAGDRFLEGILLNALGHLYHGLGQLQRARDYYRKALSLQEQSRDSVRLPSTLHNLARAERDAGNLKLSKQYAERGLQVTELLRGKVASPELRGSYLASVHQQYEFMIDLLMRLHEKRPYEQFASNALKVSEQARARSLLDILAEAHTDIREGVDAELLKHESLLQNELNAKAEMQIQLLKRKHSKEEAEALAEEIETIITKYQEVQARIRSESPHYAALTQPQPLGLPEIQQSILDEDTLLLEYELGDESSYIWAVTPNSFESRVLPKRSEIESRVRRVRELMLERQIEVEETSKQYRQRIQNADSEYRKEAAALSQILLGPVSDQLESKRLLIVAEGMLQYLPFGALPKPQKAGKSESFDSHPLIESHEVVHLPSASVLGLMRQETALRPLPPKMAAVLADPVFERDDPRMRAIGFSVNPQETPPPGSKEMADVPRQRGITEPEQGFRRLPATREEADSIMALIPEESGLKILGFDANRDAVSSPELGQYRIVHFGTHGFLDDEHPELSGLLLSNFNEEGQPQDGFLRLHDIYNLNLPVELVVLSACNSGLGKQLRGEGLVGLVRGFMYAGAKRILASLWKVEDDATAALMESFYRHMLQEGESPAGALRKAQLEISKQKRWQAPYYWAAFILQGEWEGM
jgi:CHAT domain-containing protein/Tfp pilus assembly protein PilF